MFFFYFSVTPAPLYLSIGIIYLISSSEVMINWLFYFDEEMEGLSFLLLMTHPVRKYSRVFNNSFDDSLIAILSISINFRSG